MEVDSHIDVEAALRTEGSYSIHLRSIQGLTDLWQHALVMLYKEDMSAASWGNRGRTIFAILKMGRGIAENVTAVTFLIPWIVVEKILNQTGSGFP